MKNILVSQKLIEARTAANLTQEQLAKRMGTTQSAVARAESGELPSWKWIERYAIATGYNITFWVSVGTKNLIPPSFPTAYESAELVAKRKEFRAASLARQRKKYGLPDRGKEL